VLDEAALERAGGVLHAGGRVRVDGPGPRHEQHVLEALLRERVLHEGEVAEVVGQQVLARGVVEAPGDLEHVSRRERGERERLHPGVV